VKKLVLLGFLLLSFATYAVADEISFSIVGPGKLSASPAGLTMNGVQVLVTDDTTGVVQMVPGVFTGSTGPSSSFTFGGGLVSAFYKAGAPDSVFIKGSLPFCNGCTLISGVMNDNGAFATGYQDKAGAFFDTFTVTSVDPAVLALFGLGPAFLTNGSISATYHHDFFNPVTMTVSGQVGTVGLTIITPVPEPAGLGLLGVGLLTTAGVLKRRYV